MRIEVRSLAIPWLVLFLMAVGVTVYEMLIPLAPMGDEVFQVVGLGLLLALLGSAGALSYSKPIRSATVFSLLFLVGTLGIWFKVARTYRYAYFGQQFWLALALDLLFFLALALLSVGSRKVVGLVNKWRGAT